MNDCEQFTMIVLGSFLYYLLNVTYRLAVLALEKPSSILIVNWVPLYEDWDAGIQRILSVIEPIPPKIQNLISALSSEDRDVRETAVEALGNIGAEAKTAVPALVKIIKDKNIDNFVRGSFAKALGKIGPEAKSAVPALIDALKDKNEAIRSAATNALGNIGPAAVSALIDVLKSWAKEFRVNAVYALGNIGPKAVPTLNEVLEVEMGLGRGERLPIKDVC